MKKVIVLGSNGQLGKTIQDCVKKDIFDVHFFSRNQLENLRHQVVVGPQFNLGALSANFLVKYNDRVSLEDYYTVDANLEYRYQGYKAFIKGRNIFNEIYRESSLVEMPGRWMSVGLIYKFQ